MKHRNKGKGIFQDIDEFFKKTKVISNVGQVLLPLAGASIGTFFGGPGVGSGVGAAVGVSANTGLKSLGYGRKGKGKVRGVYDTVQIPVKLSF